MASFAHQTTLSGMSDKFNGRTPVRIYFLDNSSKLLLLESETTAGDLISMLLKKCGVVENEIEDTKQYFSIFISQSGNSIDRDMSPTENIIDMVHEWDNEKIGETAKFLFMIRLYMPSLWGLDHRDVVEFRQGFGHNLLSLNGYLECSSVRDESLIHLQYIQAVYNVITSQIATTIEQTIKLGSIHFFFKFGKYNSELHKRGFLEGRIVEFISVKFLREKTIDEWEILLLKNVREMSHEIEASCSEFKSYNFENNDSDDRLSITKIQNLYLKLIYQLKFYGLTFFRCVQSSTKILSENPILALHQRGITIFDKSRKQLHQFNIEDILRWGFQPDQMFYFEPAEKKFGMLKFQTNKGEQIAKLIGDYARAFVYEKEKEDNRFILLNDEIKQEKELSNLSSSEKKKKHVSFQLKQKPKKPIDNIGIIRLQALYRGYSVRNEWHNVIREEAVIRIQASVRGFITRNHVNIMIEQMLEELQGAH